MTFLGSFPLPLHTHTLKRNQLNNQLPLSQCSGQGKGEADALPCPALPCPVPPLPTLFCYTLSALPCPKSKCTHLSCSRPQEQVFHSTKQLKKETI